MSKPWEQEWKAESLGYEARVIRDTNDYVASAQYAYPEGPVPLDDEDAVFISAAPDMARALLLALENDRTGHDAPREVIEAALRKAGVPL